MIISLLLVVVIYLLFKKNAFIWLPTYICQYFSRKHQDNSLTHIIFCFVDHFEPQWKKPSYEVEVARVDRWCEDYRQLASKYLDADGCHPKHTFFYPEEEYREEHLNKLAKMCSEGYGEIEIHLHHDNDTEAGLRNKLSSFTRTLRDKHGAISEFQDGRLAWAFIHGNWALDNSHPNGKWCGINNELVILKEEGCYVDMTMPSAPSPTQTSKINSIYYATDDPEKPKSHNTGIDVQSGKSPCGDLMMVQGILGWDWTSRKWGVIPRIENSDIRSTQLPTKSRVDNWVRLAPTVKDRPEWKFIKIHTHGTQEADMPVLLGNPADQMHKYLENKYNDGTRYCLHYVSAREQFNIIKAAEDGLIGNPNDFRNYVLPPPPHLR
ncbi:MAG: hypothetical protein GKR92_06995 [Gammaproteobacteria bacterium]|nr:MAG: hypothetical protein GKR92_06995 [Gammaproteobacteria bacterium]